MPKTDKEETRMLLYKQITVALPVTKQFHTECYRS